MRVKVKNENTGRNIVFEIDVPDTPLIVSDYSEKSILVVGGTPLVKSEMKRLGGKFGRNFTGGEPGWIFRKADEKKVREFVDAVNQFIRVKEIEVNAEEKQETVEPIEICQISPRRYTLKGDVSAWESELKAVGCHKSEDEDGNLVWWFTQLKFKYVQALLSVINKS